MYSLSFFIVTLLNDCTSLGKNHETTRGLQSSKRMLTKIFRETRLMSMMDTLMTIISVYQRELIFSHVSINATAAIYQKQILRNIIVKYFLCAFQKEHSVQNAVRQRI